MLGERSEKSRYVAQWAALMANLTRTGNTKVGGWIYKKRMEGIKPKDNISWNCDTDNGDTEKSWETVKRCSESGNGNGSCWRMEVDF